MGYSKKEFSQINRNLSGKKEPKKKVVRTNLDVCDGCKTEITGATVTSLFVVGKFCSNACIEKRRNEL